MKAHILLNRLSVFACVGALALGHTVRAGNDREDQDHCNHHYAWKNVTIGGGGFVSGVVFHPKKKDLIYARTDVGGAYRWNPVGQSWVALNDDIGGLNNEFMNQGILSIALDPKDPRKVYLAAGQYVASWAPNATLLISEDQGRSWDKVTLPFKLGGNQDGRSTGERLQVDPYDTDNLILGTTADGLWRGLHGGRSWTKITTFPASSVTFVLFDESNGDCSKKHKSPKTIYVGAVPTATTAALYRTTDGGISWTALDGQPAGLIPHHAAMSYGATNNLYIAYSDVLGPNGASLGAVYKLATASGSWTNISPPTGQGGFAGVSVDAQNPNTLVVSTLDRWWPKDQIYRSTDGGASWTAVLDNSVLSNLSAPWSSSRTPHWVGDVKIDPFNSNRAIFITGYGLWETSDLTNSDSSLTTHWTFFNDDLEETVPTSIASPTDGPFHLVDGLGDIGGFRHRYLLGSPLNLDYFTPYKGSVPCIAVAAKTPSRIVRLIDTGTYGQISSDTGTYWKALKTSAPGVANGLGAIDISADGTRLVWNPYNAAPAFSLDDGASWTVAAGASASGYHVPVADKVNSAKFYILDTAASQLEVSVDGGANFSVGATGLPATAASISAVPDFEGNLWLAAWAGGLYKSADTGASFVKVAAVAEAYQVGFGKAAPGQTYPAIYIWGKVKKQVGLYRSDDAGLSWTRINDSEHMFGYLNQITGDPRVYGRVFLATSGRGVIYGQPAKLVNGDEEPNLSDPIFSQPEPYVVYDDMMENGWNQWSWGGTFNTSDSSVYHSGGNSISLTPSETWGVCYLYGGGSNSTAGHTNLKLWIHGGSTGGQSVSITGVKGGVWQAPYLIPASSVVANTWTQVTIPLADLGVDNSTSFDLAIGIYSTDFNTFYIDDITLE